MFSSQSFQIWKNYSPAILATFPFNMAGFPQESIGEVGISPFLFWLHRGVAECCNYRHLFHADTYKDSYQSIGEEPRNRDIYIFLFCLHGDVTEYITIRHLFHAEIGDTHKDSYQSIGEVPRILHKGVAECRYHRHLFHAAIGDTHKDSYQSIGEVRYHSLWWFTNIIYFVTAIWRFQCLLSLQWN